MPRPYSPDLRHRVLAAAHAGQPHGAVAARFAVGESTVRGWLRRERLTGRAAAKPHAGGARPKVDAPAEQARPDVAAARAAWAAWQAAAPALDPADLVFVDECGVATDMARVYGRAKGGRRARGAVPYGRWHRLTVLGALTRGGLAACMAIPGAADTDVMEAFVTEVLVPALRPGQVVVLDNLSVHRAPVVRRLVEAAGCTLRFLPAYSPDLNPIEPAWSQLKARLRTEAARTVDALYDALAGAVGAITPDDARGYFRHCGYVTAKPNRDLL